MLSRANAIAKVAAKLRRKAWTHRDLSAAAWKSWSGRKETLKSVIDEISAELSRQLAIQRTRRTRGWTPYLGSNAGRRRNQLAELRQWRVTSARDFAGLSDDSPGTYRLGKYLVRVVRSEECDWNAYSKAWHRNYGPKRTVSTSMAIEWEERLSVKSRSFALSRCAGLTRRAIENIATIAGLSPCRGKSALRIDPHVELVATQSGHKFTQAFERRFCGETLGFVAVRRQAHFHADTLAEAVGGVAEKLARDRLRQRQRAVGKLIGFPLDVSVGAALRSLGFCRDGTADALSMLGLRDRQYSPSELISAGEWGNVPAVAKKYPGECATVAALVAGAGMLVPEQFRRLVAG